MCIKTHGLKIDETEKEEGKGGYEELGVTLRNGQFSAPSTIGAEHRHNPFLRCRSFEEFEALRAKKDMFG